MPKLTEVRIMARYGESIQTQIGLKNYQAEVAFTLQPETEAERDEWRDSEKIIGMQTWLHEQLVKSVHLQQLEDGTRTGNESDFAGFDEEEGDGEPEEEGDEG